MRNALKRALPHSLLPPHLGFFGFSSISSSCISPLYSSIHYLQFQHTNPSLPAFSWVNFHLSFSFLYPFSHLQFFSFLSCFLNYFSIPSYLSPSFPSSPSTVQSVTSPPRLSYTVRVWQRGLSARGRQHPADFPASHVHRGIPEPHLPLQEQRRLHGRHRRQPQEGPAPPGLQRDRDQSRGQQPLHLQRPGGWMHGEETFVHILIPFSLKAKFAVLWFMCF